MLIPPKLKEGDEIRVISPATSLKIISDDVINYSKNKLTGMGYGVSFSGHSNERDEFDSMPVSSRLDELHEAFSDKNVKCILTSLGGYNSNELLSGIDFDLIKRNPKIFSGFSDIAVLLNAIYGKTGLMTYHGPFFSTFGMHKGLDYTLEYFRACLVNDSPFSIAPSKEWSDDKWYLDQENRKFLPNKGYTLINSGEAKGRIIGGNLCSFNLLQGTPFMPNLKDSILILEDDHESNPDLFNRDLQSIINLPEFSGVNGIMIGRFQPASGFTEEILAKIIKNKKELDGLPVIAGVDFGHTNPILTLPIGGQAALTADKESGIHISVTEH
jgi:muramoyltetrapeptide carboxypeptidase LdcA involved in peptidoglycan recycling